MRGNSAPDKRDFALALRYYDEAIRLDPRSARAYYDRGLAYGHLYDFDEAIADFSAAINLDPKLTDAYICRGVVYGSKREYAKEIPTCSEAIVSTPQPQRLSFTAPPPIRL